MDTKSDQNPVCPLSGSPENIAIFDVKDHSISQESFSVFENEAIPFRFTYPIPNESTLTRYYESDDYISHSNKSIGFTARLYQFVRKFTMILKKRIVHNMAKRKSGNLMDYGCGTGEFAIKMKNAGWNIWGIEPSEKALDFAIGEHGLDVFTSINKITDSIKFDVITAWHVLEHVHHLHNTMDEFHSKLSENGTLILAVPNYQSFDAEYYKSFWAGYDVPRHLYHFSPNSMKVLAKQHGFKISHIKRLWLDSFYVSLLSESYIGHSIPFRLVRAFIVGLWSDFLALSDRERCSSLIYVLKKR